MDRVIEMNYRPNSYLTSHFNLLKHSCGKVDLSEGEVKPYGKASFNRAFKNSIFKIDGL